MTDFRDAFRRTVIAALRCPKCTASNRPGATVIDLDQTGSRAYCVVCSAEGPIANFQSPTQENSHDAD